MMKHLSEIMTPDHPKMISKTIIQKAYNYIDFGIGQVKALKDKKPRFTSLCDDVISELEHAKSAFGPNNKGT